MNNFTFYLCKTCAKSIPEVIPKTHILIVITKQRKIVKTDLILAWKHTLLMRQIGELVYESLILLPLDPNKMRIACLFIHKVFYLISL